MLLYALWYFAYTLTIDYLYVQYLLKTKLHVVMTGKTNTDLAWPLWSPREQDKHQGMKHRSAVEWSNVKCLGEEHILEGSYPEVFKWKKSRIPVVCWEAIALWFSRKTTCATVIGWSWSSQVQLWVRIDCMDLKTKGVWTGLSVILIKHVWRWFWVPEYLSLWSHVAAFITRIELLAVGNLSWVISHVWIWQSPSLYSRIHVQKSKCPSFV